MTNKRSQAAPVFSAPHFLVATILTLLLTALGSLPATGQRAVQIDYDRGSDGQYTFNAISTFAAPHVVVLEFTTLTNLNPSRRMPLVTNISGRRTRLLTLNPIVERQRSRFNYTYRYYPGCLNATPDDIEYLLPFEESAVASAGFANYVYRRIGAEEPDGWYSPIFYVEDGTTIHASRKGTVISVQDVGMESNPERHYSSERNYIRVVHDDCTVARYSVFKNNEIFVEPGDVVFPGDPLGIVAGEDIGFGNQVRLLLYHINDESVIPDENGDTDSNRWRYVQPKFRTAAGERVSLESGEEYKSIHPEEIVTEEMSRRERRRWNRQN